MEFAALDSGIVNKLHHQLEVQTRSGSWVYYTDGRKMYSSPGLYTIYDVEDTKQDLVDLVRQFYSNGAYERLADIIMQRVGQKRYFSIPLSMVSAKGIKKEVRISGKGQFSSHGKLELVYGQLQDITENDSIRKTMDFQNTVLNSICDTVIATNKEGIITFWNKTAEKQYLYTRSEVLGKNISELRPQFSTEQFLAENPEKESLVQGRDIYFDKLGNAHPVQKKISKIYNSQNEFQGILIIASDISKEIELQDQLLESEKSLRKMFEESSVPMLLVGVDGKPRRVNDAFLNLFVFDRKEFLSWSYESQIKYDLTSEDNALMTRLLCGELDSYSLDKQTRKSTGELMWLNVTTNLIRNSEGEPEVCVKIFKDITKEREFSETVLSLNEELQKNDEKIRTILSNSHDVIFILNESEVFIEVIGGAELVTGFSREEILGRTPQMLKVPGNHNWAGLVADLGGEQMYNSELTRKDGVRIQTAIHAINLLHNPFVRGVVYTVRDISREYNYNQRLKEAKLRAEEYSQLQANFLANISHEVRTPLNGIIGTAELLADDLEDPDQLELVQIQLQSANRLLKTLNNILTISSERQQERRIFEDPFELLEACRQTISLHQQRATAKGIECELLYDQGLRQISVLGSEVIFQQALGNLLDNSIKFTTDGHILIKIETDQEYAIIKVEDSGIGMSAEFLSKAFEPFTQESSGLGRKYEGNGLGLSIVKKYIASMNGTIEVTSALNKGTTFTLKLLLNNS